MTLLLPHDHEGKCVTLARHASIVQSIYAEHRDESRTLHIVMGRQAKDGHRYYGERCVWCGINYLDHTVEDDPQPCEGPREGEWNDAWWPLDKVDAVVMEHRGWDNLD